ncbi:GumC domain-containing protein [Paeniglutamicibacter gangotriensis]|uniref:Capsular polysaccharide biosynthesis protein n=1 Tax=Paeniglutamicibacter gangotriensis Lz1y TaxID=1276920 RepID=M7MWQ7_9MICC|nr:capsular polysaccharide biosynthesis protein [Paeniglutamicibacter gangotriensis]EMQ99380.1 Capsular polysaccharide biosynthesis protein [Paeniglutamicibacter gangotriensis Lz1y]
MIAKLSSKHRRRQEARPQDHTVTGVFLTPLRSPLRTILCFLVVFASCAALYFSTPAKYSARMDLVVVAVTGPSQVASDRDISIDSAVQILYSDAVVGETARELNYPGRSTGLLDELSISPLINSRILRLFVANEDPHQALAAVSLLTENFLAEREARLVTLAQTRRSELQRSIDSLAQQVSDLDLTEISSADRREFLSELSNERTQLQFAIAAIDTLPPEPGFISRQATLPTTANRPSAPIYIGSSFGLAIILSFVIAPSRRVFAGFSWPTKTEQKSQQIRIQGSSNV